MHCAALVMQNKWSMAQQLVVYFAKVVGVGIQQENLKMADMLAGCMALCSMADTLDD